MLQYELTEIRSLCQFFLSESPCCSFNHALSAVFTSFANLFLVKSPVSFSQSFKGSNSTLTSKFLNVAKTTLSTKDKIAQRTDEDGRYLNNQTSYLQTLFNFRNTRRRQVSNVWSPYFKTRFLRDKRLEKKSFMLVSTVQTLLVNTITCCYIKNCVHTPKSQIKTFCFFTFKDVRGWSWNVCFKEVCRLADVEQIQKDVDLLFPNVCVMNTKFSGYR